MPAYDLNIIGMDCSDCAKTLEKGVADLSGVQTCTVNFFRATMQVSGEADLALITQRIESLGYGVGQPEQPQTEANSQTGFVQFMLARSETALALAGVGALGLVFALSLLPFALSPLIYALELVIIGAVGLPIMRRGLRELWFTRKVTINLLMTIAVVGALLINEAGEAATVIVLFAIGEALEGYSAERARGALHSLLSLAPQDAFVIRDHEEHKVAAAEVKLGEIIFIPPAERIPLDGRVLAGISAVNQSPITGESVPVQKTAGDVVFAGSVNGDAALQVEVTSLAQDSTLSRIIRLVEEAQAQKAPAERFVDQFAAWYTPLVIVLAALVVILPPVVAGASWQTWIYRGLALLVVACPCSLVISTPVTVVSAMVRAAKSGILIKGGKYLEALGNIQAIAFDKTGTLTQGQPHVIQVKALACQTHSQIACEPCNEMLAAASAVEVQSQHPLARAVVAAARGRGLQPVLAQSVTALAGQGIRGQVNNQAVTIGSHPYFETSYPHAADLCHVIEDYEGQGQTVMLVARDQDIWGYLTVMDTPRQGAAEALRALPENIQTVMLTGDNPQVAQSVAQSVGIKTVSANLLPQDKAAAIQKLVAQYGTVAMVGDGINDAPALAAASVGIAMGGAGTAQAMETADVVLMQDDLSQLPQAVWLSQRAKGVIRENIWLSLVVKAAFILLSFFGLTTLWLAVFADVGISLLVTFNGMRLLNAPQLGQE